MTAEGGDHEGGRDRSTRMVLCACSISPPGPHARADTAAKKVSSALIVSPPSERVSIPSRWREHLIGRERSHRILGKNPRGFLLSARAPAVNHTYSALSEIFEFPPASLFNRQKSTVLKPA